MPSLTPLLDQARHWSVRYRKRQLIYDEGEPATAVFRLDQGCVRLQVNGDDGDRQIVAFLFPGDHFGVCVETQTSAAEAVTDVEATRYSLQSVLQLSQQSQDLVVQLMHTANIQFNDLAHHIAHVAHLPAHERVLWFLNWLARRQGVGRGEGVSLPMTLRDVGDYLAVSPETLSRVLSDLRAEGTIVMPGRNSFRLRPSAATLGMTLPEPARWRTPGGEAIQPM